MLTPDEVGPRRTNGYNSPSPASRTSGAVRGWQHCEITRVFQSLLKSVEARPKRRRTVSSPRCQFSAGFKSGLFRVSQHDRKPSEPVNPSVISNGERDFACPRLRKRLGYFCQQTRIRLRQVVGRTKHIHRRSKRREAFDGMLVSIEVGLRYKQPQATGIEGVAGKKLALSAIQ